jgi:hypothetical protein
MLSLHRLSFLPNRIKRRHGCQSNRDNVGGSLSIFGSLNASKAAIFILSGTICLEFGPLDVQATDLKAGTFKPKLIDKLAAWKLSKVLVL